MVSNTLNNVKNLELPYGVTLSEVNELMFDFNGHMGSYMSIEEYYEDCLHMDDWVSPEERERALANNQVWCLHWYPNTPIGSYKILCHSLEVGIKYLEEIDKELKHD